MSLRSKIVLILIAVVGLYALTTSQVQRAIFAQRFAELEAEGAAEDIERIARALRDEIESVDQIALEWSTWDDTLAFIRGEESGSYEKSCLGPERLGIQKVDVLFFLENADAQGEHAVTWSRSIDPSTGQAVALRALDHRWDKVSSRNPLLARSTWQETARLSDGPDGGERPVGILLTEFQPLIVSTRPILGSDAGGEPAGVLVLGRFLSPDLDAELTSRTLVDFDFWQSDGRHELPQEVIGVHQDIAASTSPIVQEVSDTQLHAWAAFPDLLERPELILRANVDRDLSRTGGTAMKFGLVSTLAGGFVLLSVLMLLLQKIVLAPVSRLTQHALQIGQTEDFRAKLGMQRKDELGTLAGEFDSMMDLLDNARGQVVTAARTAGMSEIATGILHNVGNVLNSVNISATIVSQRVEDMSLVDLKKVVTVLEMHKHDLAEFIGSDPSGKHLQPFLAALSEQLDEEQRTLASEVGSLTDGIEHICELIKSQQEFAVKVDLVEEVDLVSQIEEAVRITERAHGVDESLMITRDYEDLPQLQLDRHRLLEILVNLVQNARQAMADQEHRSLHLAIKRAEEGKVCLEVTDTGAGICQRNLARVFTLGFTTKPNGHGYGLHTAANAATEMGARLTAHSEGKGLGASFILELSSQLPTPAGEVR